MRVIAALIFFILAATGLILAIRENSEAGLAAAPAAALLPAATEVSGTIDYYPNNAGAQVPYLVYRERGVLATKALIFDDSSVCVSAAGAYPCALIADALSAYYGAGPVEAEGTIEDENLLVSRLSPA